MNRSFLCLMLALPALAAMATETAVLEIDGKPIVTYQALPMANPKGNVDNPSSDFRGSNFIHPLKTLSGFTLTSSQPDDHLHHFGLWWPWKHVQDGTKTINCWELQAGEGIVQGRSFQVHDNQIRAKIDYLDRTRENGPVGLLRENTAITTTIYRTHSANGYFLDLTIQQETAVNRPIVIPVYRYSGFSIRATGFWDKDNSSILTSEGKNRYAANFSKARWVLVQGATDTGGKAGLLMLSHPGNQSHPEKLRTWDEQHNGAVFINFNTVGDEPWTYLPGSTYSRRYRLFVFDGSLDMEQADVIWKAFASTD